MLREYGTLISDIQKTLDIFITVISFIAAYYIKLYLLPPSLRGLTTAPNYYIILLMIIIIWYVCYKWGGLYISYRQSSLWDFFSTIVKSSMAGMIILSLCLYALHIQNISRLLLGIFLVLNIFLLFLSKVVVFIILRRIRSKGYNTKNIIIVGSRERARDVIRSLEKYKDSGYIIKGCFDIEKEQVGTPVLNDCRVIGSIQDLEDYLKNQIVDELIFAIPLKKIKQPDYYLYLAENLGVTVRIMPDWQLHHLMFQPGIATIRFEDFMGIKTMALQTTPLNEGKLLIKSLMDYLGGIFLLILFFPLLIAIGAVIKWSSKGPVLFPQERLGLNGRRFMCYKFRTMVDNAQELQKNLMSLNEADGPAFKIKADPRIIPWIGTFLRKTSLDELPQLINVIKGEMSLVGPRPPIPKEVDEYSIWHRRRLSMKPGMTCLWQISPRRNELKFEEWMKLDLKYIDTWSLFNDLKILVLTARAILTGSGR